MEQKFDNFYMTIAQESGGIQGLFDSMFSFLQRKTDFYYEMMPGDKMGFPPGVNLKIMYELFQKYQQEHYKKHPKIDPDEYNKQLQKYKEQQEKQTENIKQDQPQKVQQDSNQSQKSQNIQKPKQEIPVVRKEEKEPQVQPMEKKVQDISTYNGGKTSNYSWSQTVTDVTFSIKLEQNTKPKDIQIDFKTKNIIVKIKNEVKMQGELYDKIHTDESFWSIEDGCLLVVNMEKGVENIWKTIVKGDDEIDASKVENQKRIDEFDDETQGALRKIMYEQNLKLNGLPTTEEQQQMEFMKKAWDADGSPFKGTPFDPSKLNMGNNQFANMNM